jgi:hypothetical protein
MVRPEGALLLPVVGDGPFMVMIDANNIVE